MHRYEVLRRPLMTEKTERMGEDNKYAFEVHREANKQQIKGAVESIFDVKVVKVHTMVVPGKSRRWGRHMRSTPAWKKAIVKVRDGDQIDLTGAS